MKKRKSQGRRSPVRKPKLPKTYEQVMALTGATYAASDEHTGIVFELVDESENQLIMVEELVEKFYRIILPEKGIKHSEIVNPVVLQLMEDPFATPGSSKYWFAIYRANFFVNIYMTPAGLKGPHTAQLWFKSFSTKQTHWIATMQLMAYYFNETEMRAELNKCLIEREWFFTPQDAKRSIVP